MTMTAMKAILMKIFDVDAPRGIDMDVIGLDAHVGGGRDEDHRGLRRIETREPDINGDMVAGIAILDGDGTAKDDEQGGSVLSVDDWNQSAIELCNTPH